LHLLTYLLTYLLFLLPTNSQSFKKNFYYFLAANAFGVSRLFCVLGASLAPLCNRCGEHDGAVPAELGAEALVFWRGAAILGGAQKFFKKGRKL
jgi:hypothetical protein